MLAELFTPKGGSGHSMGFATVKSVSGAKVTVSMSGATLPRLADDHWLFKRQGR